MSCAKKPIIIFKVEVCRLDAAGEMEVIPVALEGVLDGRPVLPEFSVPVKEIFEVERNFSHSGPLGEKDG